MGWTNWTRKTSQTESRSDVRLGLDLNASRLRVMWGDGLEVAKPVVLDEPEEEFALAAALVGRLPEFGRTAKAIERSLPHVFVSDFLKDLHLPRRWEIGRHRLTAAELLTTILQRIRPMCPRAASLTVVVPPDFSSQKVTILGELLEHCRFPFRGSVLLPLALAATTELPHRRPTTIAIVDCDAHALSISLVQIESRQARLLQTATLPRLNQRVWKDRLLAGIADRCVRVCRRDPRDTGATEQDVFEQLDGALEKTQTGQTAEVVVRSSHWYQVLVLTADDFANFCRSLVKSSIAAVAETMETCLADPPAVIWLTHAAGRLPGLLSALETHSAERTTIRVLPADAGCRAALQLASRSFRDDLPRTHIESVIPLSEEPSQGPSAIAYRPVPFAAAPRVWTEN